MPIPLSLQSFDRLHGTLESTNPVALPQIYSPGGSRNIWIDRLGRVREIHGSVIVGNAKAFGMAAWGSPSTHHLIIQDLVNLVALHGETMGIMTSISVNTSPNTLDAAQFGTTLFLTNGSFAPKTYNGVVFGIAGQTQSPTLTVTELATAGQPLGSYRYKLVSRFADDTRKAASAPSAVIQVTEKQIDVDWTADANVNVTGYELYRTTGTGTLYYFVSFIDGRTTITYQDNVSDLTILENRTLQEHGDPPPVGARHTAVHLQRMWYGGTDAFPRRAFYSDPNRPDEVGIFSFVGFDDGESQDDQLIGMVGGFEGQLIVFLEQSVWTVSGTGAVIGAITDWFVRKSLAPLGAVTHKAILRIPAGARYVTQEGETQITSRETLAYLTQLGDIRLFDGDNAPIISYPMGTTLNGMNRQFRRRVHGIVDMKNDHAIWYIPHGDGQEHPNRAIVWNFRWGVWYEWIPPAALVVTSSIYRERAGGVREILTGERTDVLVRAFVPGVHTWLDGSAIDSRWMSKPIYGLESQQGTTAAHTKRFRWVDFLIEHFGGPGALLRAEWFKGDAGNDNIPSPSDGSRDLTLDGGYIFTADGDRIVTTSNDPIRVWQSSTNELVPLKQTATGNYIHAPAMRLRIRKVSGASGWALNGFTLAYQALTGLKRRMP